jgi:glycosyltransferase involved in cell wall biosynthesis
VKNVLIITYYWPPAGGPGVQRVLKFAKYLQDYDWQPYILTVKNGEFPAMDDSLLDDVPEGIKIFKTFNPEPAVLYKLASGRKDSEPIPTFVLNPDDKDTIIEKTAKWIRANIFIPDAKVAWRITAVRKGMSIIKCNTIDLIFSSSPPQTTQLIANQLARKSGLPWVADFRDPWTDAFWQKEMKQTTLVKYFDRRLEQKILHNCTAVVTVSEKLADLFRNKAQNSYHIIPNGFDALDFKDIKKEVSEKFRIKYVGNLGISQQITPLLDALGVMDKSVLNTISLTFYGNAHSSIQNMIHKRQVQSLIKFKSYIPHQNMIQEIVDAEILLLIIPRVPENSGILTGKLFEYLATENYILGIGPENGEAAKILKQTGCGNMFPYDTDITSAIEERYHLWLKQEKPEVNKTEIEKFSRENQTKQLVKIFEQVLNG